MQTEELSLGLSCAFCVLRRPKQKPKRLELSWKSRVLLAEEAVVVFWLWQMLLLVTFGKIYKLQCTSLTWRCCFYKNIFVESSLGNSNHKGKKLQDENSWISHIKGNEIKLRLLLKNILLFFLLRKTSLVILEVFPESFRRDLNKCYYENTWKIKVLK